MAFDRPPAVPTPLGKYELLHEQAGSGIGSTWIARATSDTASGAPLYTVLRLPRAALRGAEAADAVVEEARRASSLRHQRVLALIDVGATDAEVFAVSEHVEGETLAGLLAGGGADAMPVPIALRIVLDVLEALVAAHALAPPVIHGELTPQIVHVGLDGATRVGGFGLMSALASAGWAGARGVERLAYAAPERVKEMGVAGASPAPTDRRVDIFSVGVMLWEAASQKRLFAAKVEAAVIQRVLTAPIPPLSSASSGKTPPELDALVQQALERNPERRLSSAAEVVKALEGLSPARLASHAEVAAFVQKVTGKSASPSLSRSLTPVPPPPARRVPTRKTTLLGGVSAPAAVFGAPPAAAAPPTAPAASVEAPKPAPPAPPAVKPKAAVKATETEDEGWDVEVDETRAPAAAAKVPEPAKPAEPGKPVVPANAAEPAKAPAAVKAPEPVNPPAAAAKAPEPSKTPEPAPAPVRPMTPATSVTAATSTTPARPGAMRPGARPPTATLPLGTPLPVTGAKARAEAEVAAKTPEPASVAVAPEPAPVEVAPEPAAVAKQPAAAAPAAVAPEPTAVAPEPTAVAKQPAAAAPAAVAPEPTAVAKQPAAAAPAAAAPEPAAAATLEPDARPKPGARPPPAPRPLGGKPGSTAVVSSGDAAAAGSASFTARSFGQGKRPSVEPKVVIGSNIPPPPPLPPGHIPPPVRAPTPVAAIPPPPPPEEPSVDSRRGRNATELDKLGVGSTLGRYEILMPVARGGMASVWAARIQGSRGFQKIFAIKTMLPDVSDDPEFESMFLDEGRVAARIRHPNVAEILDIGEQDEVLYLVMEWVEGENLGTLMRAARNVGGMPLPIALRIASHTCAGLHAAHELRDDSGNLVDLVHRDVSPANVLVSIAGFVKLVDFGVAKSKNRLHQTRAGGMVKGKTPYLSPEQLGQLPIDRRSDIFSFGALLYVLLTGLHPFRGDSESKTIENIALRDPVSMRQIIPTIPAELEKVVFKALEKDPNKRFSTAAELQRALDQVAASLGVVVTDQDVAAFIDKVIGEPLAKRKQDLQRSIASLDTTGGRPDAAHPPVPAVFPGTPFAPPKPVAREAPLPSPVTDRPTMPEPSAVRGGAREQSSSIVDEVSFEEIHEPMDPQLAAAVVPVPKPAAAEREPALSPAPRAPASPPPALALSAPAVTSEVMPEKRSTDASTDDIAPPPQRRSALKFVVGGVLGACALLGALAVVASNGKGGPLGKVSSKGSAAVTEAARPAETASLPARAEAPKPAAKPEPTATTEPAPAPTAKPEPAAAASEPAPAPPEPERAETPPAPAAKPGGGAAAVTRPTTRPVPKPPPAGKGSSKPPKKYNPTGI